MGDGVCMLVYIVTSCVMLTVKRCIMVFVVALFFVVERPSTNMPSFVLERRGGSIACVCVCV